jgi:hypothetical protein
LVASTPSFAPCSGKPPPPYKVAPTHAVTRAQTTACVHICTALHPNLTCEINHPLTGAVPLFVVCQHQVATFLALAGVALAAPADRVARGEFFICLWSLDVCVYVRTSVLLQPQQEFVALRTPRFMFTVHRSCFIYKACRPGQHLTRPLHSFLVLFRPCSVCRLCTRYFFPQSYLAESCSDAAYNTEEMCMDEAPSSLNCVWSQRTPGGDYEDKVCKVESCQTINSENIDPEGRCKSFGGCTWDSSTYYCLGPGEKVPCSMNYVDHASGEKCPSGCTYSDATEGCIDQNGKPACAAVYDETKCTGVSGCSWTASLYKWWF